MSFKDVGKLLAITSKIKHKVTCRVGCVPRHLMIFIND